MVYVSTAYCHLKEAQLKEKIYSPPADPHEIIKCAEFMEESIMEQMTKKWVIGIKTKNLIDDIGWLQDLARRP